MRSDLCSYRKKCGTEACAHRAKAVLRQREKEAICKPRRGAAGETGSADTLFLDPAASRTVRKSISVVEAAQTVVLAYASPAAGLMQTPSLRWQAVSFSANSKPDLRRAPATHSVHLTAHLTFYFQDRKRLKVIRKNIQRYIISPII